MATTGHESEVIDVQGLASAMAKAMNLGISNKGTCGTAADTAAKTVQVGDGFALADEAMVIVTFGNAVSTSGATLNVNSTGAKPIYYNGAALASGLVQAGSKVILRYNASIVTGQDTETGDDITGAWEVVGSLGAIYEDFGGSGNGHKAGLVPDPGATPGTGKYLREDGTWQTIGIKTINSVPIVGSGNVDLQVPITDLRYIGCAYVTCATASATAAKTATLTGFELRTNCIVSVLFANGFTTSNSTLNINNTGAKPIFYHGAAVEPLEILSNTVAILQYDGTNWNAVSIERIVRNYGNDFVDLGLPSGLLWRNRNVGADSPENYGLYFSWGNVEGYVAESGKTYELDTLYANSYGKDLTGNIPQNDVYDAAKKFCGGDCRIPTKLEYDELVSNCTYSDVTINSIACHKVTSKINGNYIILPKGGGIGDNNAWWAYGRHSMLWSSTYYSSTNAWRHESSTRQMDYPRRFMFPIRPVV